MDYNDIIRYMMNLSKGAPKTAGNRTTNTMNKLNSIAQKGRNNTINVDFKQALNNNPRYKAQQIKAIQDRAASAWDTTKNIGGKTYKVLRWGGTAAAGAVGIDNYIMGKRLMQEGIRTGNKQMQQEGLDRMHKAQLTLIPLAAGGAAKGVAALTSKAAQAANAAKMTPAYKTALQEAGVNSKVIGAMETLPEALSNVMGNTTTWLNRGGNVLTHPGTLFATPFLVNAKNAIRNFYDNRANGIANGNNNSQASSNQDGRDTAQMGNGNNPPTTPQGSAVRTGGGVPGGYYGGNASGMVNPQAVNQAINNTTTTQQPGDVENSTQYSDIDPGEIYQRYLDKQEALEPYRRGLQNYVRDYHRLSDLSYNQDKYLALLAAQTGATGLNNLMGKYTAIGDEAKALDLQKLYGNEIKNVGEGLDKLQGNIAMAQQMGLPIESVLADDDYVKLALTKEMASDKLENALLRLQMNLDNKNYWNNAKYQLSKARLGNSRGGGRASQKTTMGAWNVYNDLVEEKGIDPATAANYVNATFGSGIKPLQVGSTNLYGGRTLHR